MLVCSWIGYAFAEFARRHMHGFTEELAEMLYIIVADFLRNLHNRQAGFRQKATTVLDTCLLQILLKVCTDLAMEKAA